MTNLNDNNKENLEESNSATQPKNPQQSATKKYTGRDVYMFLKERFPKCFLDIDAGEAKPLKIGILEDVVSTLGDIVSPEGKYSKTAIRSGIKYYAASKAYLDASVEGAKRIDLDGNECGEEIDGSQAEYAAEKFKTMQEAIERAKAQKEEKRAEVQKANQANRKPHAGPKPNGGMHGDRKNSNYKPGGKPGLNRNSRFGNNSGTQRRAFGPFKYVQVDLGTLRIRDFVSVKTAGRFFIGVVDEIKGEDIVVRMRNGSLIHTKIDDIRLSVKNPDFNQNRNHVHNSDKQ